MGYPIFGVAPDTSFLCEVQPVEGYYADQEGDCQLYHVCSDIGDGLFSKFDFLCPNGTIFNQEEFVCDWWFNVDCSNADAFYELNIEVAEKNAERQRLRDLERENGEEQEKRERKELSFDEINDIRNGNRQGKSQQEAPRTSPTKAKQTSRPFSSQLQKTNPVTSKPFTGNDKQPSNSFRGGNRPTANSFRESNRQTESNPKPSKSFGGNRGQAGNSFGGNTRQSGNSFGGGNTRQTSITLKGSNRQASGSSKQSSSNRKKKPKNANFGSSQRQTAKPTSRTRNTGTQSRRGKQKSGKKGKVNAFTNFGNGQSRFGNF